MTGNVLVMTAQPLQSFAIAALKTSALRNCHKKRKQVLLIGVIRDTTGASDEAQFVSTLATGVMRRAQAGNRHSRPNRFTCDMMSQGRVSPLKRIRVPPQCPHASVSSSGSDMGAFQGRRLNLLFSIASPQSRPFHNKLQFQVSQHFNNDSANDELESRGSCQDACPVPRAPEHVRHAQHAPT
jgi:hypothetical protein